MEQRGAPEPPYPAAPAREPRPEFEVVPRPRTTPATGGLTVEGLVKRFDRVTAVDGLSMAVRPGEILALLGPNGAGKTTTLLCLAGLLRPDAGAIAWDGRRLGVERTRQMALIPETPEVYEMLTVWEHMVFVARSCKVDAGWPERAERLIERLELAPKRDTLGDGLSKGMRQKLLIACAVLAGTPVLLLDEPMIGLDPKGQRELRDILVEVRQQGGAIVVSTHLLEYIDTLCDRVVILKAGRAVLSGGLDEIRHQRGDRNLEDIFLEVTR
ncbi:MAG TPA: ABC transporter ATP-binding protein [Candidatus Limnocylindrales bacterium]|nr:ABC transporter ATP-binding protein [Candidatus Limnocylindrales bacterium]